jgi:predicted DNA-binding transcriptional regulator YafY
MRPIDDPYEDIYYTRLNNIRVANAFGGNLHTSPRLLRQAPQQRLEFIEFRLYWNGAIKRADITEQFRVSVPQAANDLATYRRIAPDNLRYDTTRKRYVPTLDFSPRFLKENPERYLAQMKALADGILALGDTWLGQSPSTSVLPIPSRRTNPTVLRTMLDVVRRNLSVRVRYQSTSPGSPAPTWRWISPHAFGFDGLRWHIRAFCHRDERFKDFILGRCLAVESTGEAAANVSDDWQWNEFFHVILKPNPELTAEQQSAVALDYGMVRKKLTVSIRCALLYYFNKRLRLDIAAQVDEPRERPIVVANQSEFDDALKRVGAWSSIPVLSKHGAAARS